VSLRAHLLHDRPIASLALVDVVALRPWGSPFFRLVWEHHHVFEELPAAIHEGLVRAYVGTAQPRPLHRQVEDALARPWLSAEGQAAFYRQMAHADERHTAEIEPLLGGIDVPTLVVWGARDPWIPVERGRELASRIPGARLEVLPEAGHLLHEEEPEELARLLATAASRG
jgi:pimeloyl-ACP methyl ester carboxylesterase